MIGVASFEGDNLLVFFSILLSHVNYLPQERPPLSSGQIADVSMR
jgi:hypothetical protein